jgi:hypothetical protein
MPSVPRDDERTGPERVTSRPAWRDIPAEDRERITRAMARLLASAWRDLDGGMGTVSSEVEPSPPAVEMSPAQKARLRARHARRIAFEQPEAES